MIPSTPAPNPPRNTPQTPLNPPTPSAGPPPSSTRKRASPLKAFQKLERILLLIKELGWTLSDFLKHLLIEEEGEPSGSLQEVRIASNNLRKNMLGSLLNGTSKPHMGELLDQLYVAAGEFSYRKRDKTRPTSGVFVRDFVIDDIEHARPAIATWAVRFVSALVSDEAKQMIDRETGLHMRAQAKEGGRGRNDELKVTWNAVETFSMKNLEDLSKENAPIMWHLLAAYTGLPEDGNTRNYRPQDLVCTNALMNLTCGRSNRANLMAMCRGIWMFASRASKTMFRVASRLGESVSYQSVYAALTSMAEKKQHDLKESVASPKEGEHYWVVSDNIQAYARVRDHRMGRESKLVKGMAATAIKMEGISPEAFDLKTLLDNQAKQERKDLTPETILKDIDFAHLDNVATFQFLQALIHFVPSLSSYRPKLKEFTIARLQKLVRPKCQKSKIIPLATNSADEMLVQELKQGMLDFATTQMGLDDSTLKGRCWPFSGDGKTFDVLHRLRRFMAAEEGDFDSFRWMVPMLEIWHTKWTDMSRVIREHWGTDDDPSSLAALAKSAECPTPSNLRKVDFYDGSHLIDLALDAHLINCWENHYGTDNLVAHFETLAVTQEVPTFEQLTVIAEGLVKQHATTDAWLNATEPPESEPTNAPLDNDSGDLPLPKSESGDTSMANSIGFIRDAIWWREVCLAVAEGDTGRILEMFRVWIFTFAGSGNPLYSNFLLEVYCNFKWEFSPKLQEAILMFWLVNISGKPGFYIELDLLQEHFNFWLEEMVQHKGKEFSDKFYRSVVSMNVHHFLRLKDEMEEAVLLKARGKHHSERHLNNELKAMLVHIRRHQLNIFQSGRSEGYKAKDNFAEGLQQLKNGKLNAYISKSLAYSDILGMHESLLDPNLADLSEEEVNNSDEISGGDGFTVPPPRMAAVDGEIYFVESTSGAYLRIDYSHHPDSFAGIVVCVL